VSPGHRRDFLLDSGAVTALANNKDLLTDYTDLLKTDYHGSMFIPVPVLTEIRTGDPRKDVLVDLLIKAIRGKEGVYLALSPAAASRAGVLRTETLPLISAKEVLSTTDPQIVGSAEERSAFCAITILTTDPKHINLLVDRIRRPNVAVKVVH
jgi:hypothetical protein